MTGGMPGIVLNFDGVRMSRRRPLSSYRAQWWWTIRRSIGRSCRRAARRGREREREDDDE